MFWTNLHLIFAAVEYQIIIEFDIFPKLFFSLFIELVIYFAIIVPVIPPAQNLLLVWLSNNKY